MRVNSVTLEYYRNYLSARAEFHPGMNIICGDNAQGKTNLLEAVAYLSAARSHRARYDRELILFGVEHGFITGEMTEGEYGQKAAEAGGILHMIRIEE